MTILEVENLWKKFRVPHERRTTIFENAERILSGKRATYDVFWAVKEVNFTVNLGESWGIIGENGSGKSTLLKVIANILRADVGNVTIHRKIAPLIALGMGFHQDLTVRENIQVYGAIMGLNNATVNSRTDSILQFSELERFQNARLKNLSTGMQSRLSFSVAIETDADIFLIDEALAVGDMMFQRKCLSKFQEFKKQGKTIILVSHSMSLVKDFCERTILMSKGSVITSGETEQIIKEYERRSLENMSS